MKLALAMNWPNERSDTWRTRWALNSIRALPRGVVPSAAVIDALRAGWGRGVPAPSTDELLDLARHVVESAGPILEYGSGVTTVLLAALAAARGLEVWTVEPDGARHMRVARMLSAHGLSVRWCRVLMEGQSIVWSDPSLDTVPSGFTLLAANPSDHNGPSGRDCLPPALRGRLDRAAIVLPAVEAPAAQSAVAGLSA